MKSMLFTIVSLSAACLSTLPSEAQNTEPPWRRSPFPPDMCNFRIISPLTSKVTVHSNSVHQILMQPKGYASYQSLSKSSKSDPTLRFISADEPFVQPGAPPFPMSFDFANRPPTSIQSHCVSNRNAARRPAKAVNFDSHPLPTTYGTATPANNETSDAFEKAPPRIHFWTGDRSVN